MTFFCIRALAIILEPTRWLTRWFLQRARPVMRAAKQQAGRVPRVCDTVNMLLSPSFRILQYSSWLATGSAPCMALMWGHTYSSFDERATNGPEEIHLVRTTLVVAAGWVYLRHFQLAFNNPWLLANVLGTRMPIQEREQWADNCVEQVDERRDAWRAIPFVRMFQDVRRALCHDSAGSVVVLGLVNPSLRGPCGVHPRAQPAHARTSTTSGATSLRKPSSGEPPARPEASAVIEVVLACASDKAAATADTVWKAISSKRDAI